MEGLGACSLCGGREHTRPGFGSRDRTRLRRPLGPGSFMELSQAELGQLLESIMWQRAVSHRAPRWPLAGNACTGP